MKIVVIYILVTQKAYVVRVYTHKLPAIQCMEKHKAACNDTKEEENIFLMLCASVLQSREIEFRRNEPFVIRSFKTVLRPLRALWER